LVVHVVVRSAPPLHLVGHPAEERVDVLATVATPPALVLPEGALPDLVRRQRHPAVACGRPFVVLGGHQSETSPSGRISSAVGGRYGSQVSPSVRICVAGTPVASSRCRVAATIAAEPQTYTSWSCQRLRRTATSAIRPRSPAYQSSSEVAGMTVSHGQ